MGRRHVVPYGSLDASMIEFAETQGRLELIYTAESDSSEWVEQKLQGSGEVRIARTFCFSEEDAIRKPDEAEDQNESDEIDETNGSYVFALGILEEGYFKIAGQKLGIVHDVYLAVDLPISRETFIAYRNISIFRQIARVTAEDIYVGGDKPDAMPISDFEKLLKSFPNSTELDRYADAKVARIVRDYFETTTPAEKKLEEYLNRRGREARIRDIPEVYQFESSKYEFIRDKIVELLEDESSFSENEWRDLMLQFILLIFPKYVCVLRNVLVKDFYTSPKKSKNRYIDIALIDANGNIDIIEIKKPWDNCLMSESNYRGNFTPRKELSGTIMQAEKYLFHLSKWGVTGEKDITSRQSSQLLPRLKVKITNPKAIVIAGRSNTLSAQQLFDFELVKRKYANIIDILSYDDLLGRLSSIIEKFKRTA
jgi:Shedu protein SduA, C-terminal